jgi:hypothetical protein
MGDCRGAAPSLVGFLSGSSTSRYNAIGTTQFDILGRFVMEKHLEVELLWGIKTSLDVSLGIEIDW